MKLQIYWRQNTISIAILSYYYCLASSHQFSSCLIFLSLCYHQIYCSTPFPIPLSQSLITLTLHSVLKLVNHPNIIRMEGLYESKQYLYIVMEMLTGGELFERIVGRPRYVLIAIYSIDAFQSCCDVYRPYRLPLPLSSSFTLKSSWHHCKDHLRILRSRYWNSSLWPLILDCSALSPLTSPSLWSSDLQS